MTKIRKICVSGAYSSFFRFLTNHNFLNKDGDQLKFCRVIVFHPNNPLLQLFLTDFLQFLSYCILKLLNIATL